MKTTTNNIRKELYELRLLQRSLLFSDRHQYRKNQEKIKELESQLQRLLEYEYQLTSDFD